MSDQAGDSDHLTSATTQSRQYKDERMERHSSQAKQGIVINFLVLCFFSLLCHCLSLSLSIFALTDQVLILI